MVSTQETLLFPFKTNIPLPFTKSSKRTIVIIKLLFSSYTGTLNVIVFSRFFS